MNTSLILALLVLVLYQAWVSWRVAKDDSATRARKSAQIALAWLVPLAGAILVHWILLAQSRQRDAPSGRYARYQDYQEHATSPKTHDDS